MSIKDIYTNDNSINIEDKVINIHTYNISAFINFEDTLQQKINYIKNIPEINFELVSEKISYDDIISIINIDELFEKISYNEKINILNIDELFNKINCVENNINLNIDIRSYDKSWPIFKILIDFLERAGVGDVFDIR